MKLGRIQPRPQRKLELHAYRTMALPTPPPTCDWSVGNGAEIVCAQMYDNDRLGDCVIAGGYHLIGVASSVQAPGAKGFIASESQILADYGAIGGYNPADPSTDNGCDEITAMNYWADHGFADGSKVQAWGTVPADNQTLVKQSIWLFETLLLGIGLPDAWLPDSPTAAPNSDHVWDVAGDAIPTNGHCVVGVGYTKDGIIVITWGGKRLLTWAALAKYAVSGAGGECYSLLLTDEFGQLKQAPNGFDYSAINAAFASIRSNP